MITINVIENQISGSYGDTPFSVNYSEDTYKKMMELSGQTRLCYNNGRVQCTHGRVC